MCQLTFSVDPERQNIFFDIVDSGPLDYKNFGRCLLETYCRKTSNDLDVANTYINYQTRWDQLFNFNDCGRLSLIYFINRLKGTHPKDLTPVDVYGLILPIRKIIFSLLFCINANARQKKERPLLSISRHPKSLISGNFDILPDLSFSQEVS